MEYLAVGARCLIGVVFLASFISKVVSRAAFEAFVDSIGDMRLLPAVLVKTAAVIVVVTECAVFLLLAVPTPLTAVTGFVAAAIMLTVFGVGILSVIRRGVRASCQCFGRSTAPLGLRHVLRNVVLVSAATVGAVTTMLMAPAQGWTAAVAVAGGLVMGGLVIMFDDIVMLFRPVDESLDSVHSVR
ncbi:MauE/DoxX family redox-associated membrane protein [Streptosporangium sp. NPDC002524]|uniref:MauE/DoxX family redox-associated membrane protein n=1 Tax=Streptosporangium sp. NPDC002524 TaxID=3154537 RepID=UPI003327D4B5